MNHFLSLLADKIVLKATSYRCHCDEGPPIGIQHISEWGARVIIFKHIGQGREDEDTHCEEQHQQTKLLITVFQSKSQTLKTHRVASQLENPEMKVITL